MDFQIYTMFVYRLDLLLNAISSLETYASKLVVVDNSPDQNLMIENFQGEIYRPDTPLFCSQSYNLTLGFALARRQEAFFIMDSDAVVTPDVIERTIAHAIGLSQRGERWGILSSLNDLLCLCNTQVIKDFRWDPYLPLCFTDVDYTRRLRLAGIPILQTGLAVGHQEGGGTSVKSDPALFEFVGTNLSGWKAYYERKWGGAPGNETYTAPFNIKASLTEVEAEPQDSAARIEVSLYVGKRDEIEGVRRLRGRCGFPETKPDVTPFDHGWLQGDTAAALAQRLSGATRVIVELGSWLGRSTRYMADCAPRATVIAIDHWLGSEEQRDCAEFKELIPILYETFLATCWEYRDRIIPLRLSTVNGMQVVNECGIAPDLIYVDASHDYESVRHDVRTAIKLFPTSALVGDDWFAPGVQEAVREIVAEGSLENEFGCNVTAWWIDLRSSARNSSDFLGGIRGGSSQEE